MFRRFRERRAAADEALAMEWPHIPHFNSPFCVRQHTTGCSAAAAPTRQIVTEGKPARARYLRFLSSGSSDYSIELFKRAGVDMSSPKPIMDANDSFNKTLGEIVTLKEQGARLWF